MITFFVLFNETIHQKVHERTHTHVSDFEYGQLYLKVEKYILKEMGGYIRIDYYISALIIPYFINMF